MPAGGKRRPWVVWNLFWFARLLFPAPNLLLMASRHTGGQACCREPGRGAGYRPHEPQSTWCVSPHFWHT